MATYLNGSFSSLEPDDILDFEYTGEVQEVILPVGQYKLECWGAEGGEGSRAGGTSTYFAGKGGYSTGVITLTSTNSIYIYTGGQGIAGSADAREGGFNGGGAVASTTSSYYGGSGGGASDIRVGQDSLYARVIVAGGGGGSSSFYGSGGYGGGETGESVYYSSTGVAYATGGIQTEGGTCSGSYGGDNGGSGAFGLGGAGVGNTKASGAGGGGGWYGGAAGKTGSNSNGQPGGGGGSGYIYTSSTASNYPEGCLLNSNYYLDEAEIIAGNQSFLSPTGGNETGHSGNGFVRITVIYSGEPDYTIYNIDDIAMPEQVIDFEYTGSMQTTTLQAGQYKLECWGAQGANFGTTAEGGKGGYSTGILTLTIDTPIYVYTGGQGSQNTITSSAQGGGFNGGGNAYTTSSSYLMCGGGGASDIRIGQDSLYARVIVAGGGGGSGRYSASTTGGFGGGLTGEDAYDYSTSYLGGNGGSQTAAGNSYYGTTENSTSIGTLANFGNGASAISGGYVSGGGGGWYGGGYSRNSGGGGGSGYVYTESTTENYPEGCLLEPTYYLTTASTIAGDQSFSGPDNVVETGHSGNGFVRITRLDEEEYIPPTLEPKDKIKCNYNGNKRIIQLPAGCYNIKCYGAQGGNAKASGGLGGYATGILKLDGTETLYIYVGGQGTSTVDASNNAKGGFNGGGDARTSSTSYHTGSGGGASDIRINSNSLYARVIVAGGGGGSGGYTIAMNGGNGGGIEGIWGKQYSTSYYHGKGGTQLAAGISYNGTSSNSTTYFTLSDFGLGGSAKVVSYNYRSGGGGGWYGGGGADYSGAGGGSSYVWTPESASNYPTGCLLDEDHYIVNGHLQTGKRRGNGYIELEYLGKINLINIDDIKIQNVPIINETTDFEYTGEAQEIQLVEGTYKLECWGAQGARSESNTTNTNLGVGGKGGYSYGTITINQPTTAFIYVGGQGFPSGCDEVDGAATVGVAKGGFNGGGYSYGSSASDPAGGGGGASDIRINQDSLYARVIVAGGGSGGGEDTETGGVGGGASGTATGSGTAGTQTGPSGCFGQAQHTNCDGGGAGGGWYGGSPSGATTTIPTSGSGNDTSGGPGGSGYVYTDSTASNYPSGCLLNSSYYLVDAETIAGNTSFVSPTGDTETGHTGHGFIRITPITITGDTTPPSPPKLKFKKGDIIYSYYNGKKRQVNFPKGIFKIETYGASGGNGLYSYSGNGGYSQGILIIQEKNIPIYVYSGGQGTELSAINTIVKGGFNGGGNAYSTNTNYYGGSGGGASDIRIGQDSLYARIIAAGGGGGGGNYNDTAYSYNVQGGAGGGTSGADGGQYNTSYLAGKAGTQTAAGNSYYQTYENSTTYSTPASFGMGGSQKSAYSASGGGGGWYGGGSSYYSGAGGGSGYVYTEETSTDYPEGCLLDSSMYLTDASTTTDVQEGNGYVQFTVIKASGLNGRVKINNEWKEIDSLLIKQNNEWKEIDSILLKVDNTWKET